MMHDITLSLFLSRLLNLCTFTWDMRGTDHNMSYLYQIDILCYVHVNVLINSNVNQGSISI